MFYVFFSYFAVIKYDAMNILIDKYWKISMRMLYSEGEKTSLLEISMLHDKR